MPSLPPSPGVEAASLRYIRRERTRFNTPLKTCCRGLTINLHDTGPPLCWVPSSSSPPSSSSFSGEGDPQAYSSKKESGLKEKAEKALLLSFSARSMNCLSSASMRMSLPMRARHLEKEGWWEGELLVSEIRRTRTMHSTLKSD